MQLNLQIVSVVPSRQSAKPRPEKAEYMEDYVGEEYDAVVLGGRRNLVLLNCQIQSKV